MTPLDRLEALRAALDRREPLPADLAAWLLEGVDDLLASDGNTTLCRALGLRAPGYSLWKELKIEVRDAALNRAFDLAPSGADSSKTARADLLAAKIRRFECTTWRAIGHLDEPPARLNPWQRALFEAFRVGIPVPTSGRAIYDIVTKPTPPLLPSWIRR